MTDGSFAAEVAEQARYMRMMVIAGGLAGAASAATATTPRRFIAGVGLCASMGAAKLAVKALPKDAPTRVFIEGMAADIPITWRSVPRFARIRPTTR